MLWLLLPFLLLSQQDHIWRFQVGFQAKASGTVLLSESQDNCRHCILWLKAAGCCVLIEKMRGTRHVVRLKYGSYLACRALIPNVMRPMNWEPFPLESPMHEGTVPRPHPISPDHSTLSQFCCRTSQHPMNLEAFPLESPRHGGFVPSPPPTFPVASTRQQYCCRTSQRPIIGSLFLLNLQVTAVLFQGLL